MYMYAVEGIEKVDVKIFLCSVCKISSVR